MSHQFYLAVKGQKQGVVRGDSTDAVRRGKWCGLLSFRYGAEAPIDANSGLPSGKRSHQPITVTKEQGPSSPQLMNAHWSGELLQEVIIEIADRQSAGRSPEVVVQRITLTNATITSVKRYTPRLSDESERTTPRTLLDDFTFGFERIEVSILG